MNDLKDVQHEMRATNHRNSYSKPCDYHSLCD